MIKNVRDVVLNVKPIFIGFEHKYYYEGPCRISGGESLQPGADAKTNDFIYKKFVEAVHGNLAEPGFKVLDPTRIACTDDWEIREEYFETLLADEQQTDVYIVHPTLGANLVFEEFAGRTSRPVCINPSRPIGVLQVADAIRSGSDVIVAIDWPTLVRKFKAVRAQKVLRKANVLLAPRFNAAKSKAGDSGAFFSLAEVTRRLGTHFRFMNLHELLDQMVPLPEGGNPTTPGRVTPNITPEEIEECSAQADELLAGAKESTIEKDMLVKTLIAHKQVTKLMEQHDCMAFTVPCADACSSRRNNELQFTFCMTHSLNLENGLASACEYDTNAALCELALMALTTNAPYLGNIVPLMTTPDGRFSEANIGLTEDDVKDVDDLSDLYYSYHSTPCRKLHGLDGEPDDYSLRHFALDQGFGGIQRHDFDKDRGQKITFMRFAADLSEMFIGSGEVVTGLGYDTDSCGGGVVFRVADKMKLFEKQATFGLHLPLVYGDCAYELGILAERLGMTPVFC